MYQDVWVEHGSAMEFNTGNSLEVFLLLSLYSTAMQNCLRRAILRYLTQKIVLLRYLTQRYQHVGISCIG